MKIAGILAIVLGCGLLVAAIMGVREDGKNAADNISKGFDEIRNHDDVGLQHDFEESRDRSATEQHESLSGAILIIAGIALIGKSKSDAKAMRLA